METTIVPPEAYGPRRPAPSAKNIPTQAGVQTVFIDEHPRCVGWDKRRRCGKLLAQFVARPWSIKCGRCGTINTLNTPAPPPVSTMESTTP